MSRHCLGHDARQASQMGPTAWRIRCALRHPWLRYQLIGAAELAAAGILIGLWWHPFGVAAAAGMALHSYRRIRSTPGRTDLRP